jgi:hypothetical protein
MSDHVTLILSLLTDKYVVLVSDRRITWTTQDKATKEIKVEKQEDSDTKTFNLYGQFLMGFTGIARFRGHRLERWVSDTLANVEPGESFLAIRNGLIDEFRRVGPGERKVRQAFLSVGYVTHRGSGYMRPVRVLVSNSLDANGQWSSKVPVSKFEVAAEPLGNRRRLLTSVGYDVKDDLRKEAVEVLRKIVQQHPDDPLPAAGILVQCLRITAAASDGWVGSNAMVATLPRGAVPAPYITMPLAPSAIDGRNQPLAFYLRQEAKTQNEAEFYAPALIRTDFHSIGAMFDPERLPAPPEGY